MRIILFPISMMLLSTPAGAEVVSADDHGFEIRQNINLVVPKEDAFAAIGRVQDWWDKAHTYSGDASRMSLQLRPGGCFCERLDDGGGIEHMRVAYLQPGERVVMTGSLGPLLYEATAGVMDLQVEPIAGGSRITLNYRAAGFAKGGAASMAPLVDQVLGAQMKRLRVFAAGGGKR